MAISDFSYEDLKKVEELRKDLLAAFASNASMRAKKIRLEKSLARIEAKLASNERVTEVLTNPKYRSLSIGESKEFLRDLELEAVKKTLKSVLTRVLEGYVCPSVRSVKFLQSSQGVRLRVTVSSRLRCLRIGF